MAPEDTTKQLSKGRFLVAVCAFIFNGDKILITRRSEDRDHDPGRWECVSGRFNQDFATVEAEIAREIREELGNKFTFQLIAPISFYHFYRAERKEDELVGINYLCEYLGGEIALSREHTDYRWLEPEKMLELDIHPLLRRDIEHLIQVKDFYRHNKALFLAHYKESN